MTMETYSNVFETHSNKPIGASTDNESDEDEQSRPSADPSYQRRNFPNGVSDSDPNPLDDNSKGEGYIRDVDGGVQFDYGHGSGSRDSTADYTDARSYDHGFSTQAATEIAYYASGEYDNNDLDEKNPYYHDVRSKFKRLSGYNRGTAHDYSDSDRQTEECQTEYFTVTRNFAAKLNIEGHFVHDAGRLLQDYPINKTGTEHALEKAALSALSLAHKKHFHNEIPESNIISDNKNVGDRHDGHSTAVSYTKAPFSSWKDGFASWSEYSEDGLNHRAQPIHQTSQFKKLMNDYDMDESETELRSIQVKLKDTDAYKEVYCETETEMETENSDTTESPVDAELSFLEHAGGGEITDVERPSTMMVSVNNTSVASA